MFFCITRFGLYRGDTEDEEVLSFSVAVVLSSALLHSTLSSMIWRRDSLSDTRHTRDDTDISQKCRDPSEIGSTEVALERSFPSCPRSGLSRRRLSYLSYPCEAVYLTLCSGHGL